MDALVASGPPPALNAPSDEEAPPEGDAGREVVIANVPQQSGEQRAPDFPCIFVIHRLMGTHGEPSLHVTYSHPFRIVVLFSLVASLLWMVHFLLEVLPSSTKASEGACHFSDDQLRQNAVVLFAYFVCFAFIRICMFCPGVAARVAGIQIGNEGVWRQYALHMILHGPLYIFGIGSVLFAFQLLISPKCEEEPAAHQLHQQLRWYAHFSCAVFGICLVLAHFHGRLITTAARRHEADKRRAPSGALENLTTYIYKDHEHLFGDDKEYPAECPICLSEWEDDDIIKVLHCGHSFHKDCIGCWMQTERTCAFCRQDIVDCPGRSYSSSNRSPSRDEAMVAPEVSAEPVSSLEEPEAQVIGAVSVEPNTSLQLGGQIVPRQPEDSGISSI